MQRRLALAAIAACVLAVAPLAGAGQPVSKLGTCPGAFDAYSPQSQAAFRTAFVCLLGELRKSQKLPALSRSALLEKSAQSHARYSASHGYVGHNERKGSSIVSRILATGYKAQALNEAVGAGDAIASPYDLLADMADSKAIPCTTLLDPRFKDVGVGIDVGEFGHFQPPFKPLKQAFLVLNFGLKAGSAAPSSNMKPSKSCPHALPKPPVSGEPVAPEDLPKAGGDSVTFTVRCKATVPCAASALLQLPDAHANSAPVDLDLPPGGSQLVTFTFDPAAIQDELAATRPRVHLTVGNTSPAKRTDDFDAPLGRA